MAATPNTKFYRKSQLRFFAREAFVTKPVPPAAGFT